MERPAGASSQSAPGRPLADRSRISNIAVENRPSCHLTSSRTSFREASLAGSTLLSPGALPTSAQSAPASTMLIHNTFFTDEFRPSRSPSESRKSSVMRQTRSGRCLLWSDTRSGSKVARRETLSVLSGFRSSRPVILTHALLTFSVSLSSRTVLLFACSRVVQEVTVARARPSMRSRCVCIALSLHPSCSLADNNTYVTAYHCR